MEGAVVLIAVAVVLGQGWMAGQIRAQYDEAVRVGGNVVVVSSDGGMVDRTECDRLAIERGDVAMSGSVRAIDTVYSADTPANAVQAGVTSGDFLAVASGARTTTPRGTGVILGELAAWSVGAAPGSKVEWTDAGPLDVLAVVSFADRAEVFGIWRLAATAERSGADECWVEAEPGMRASVAGTVLSSLPSSPEASVGVLRDETPEDAVDESLRTGYRVLPWVGAAAAAILLALLGFVERQAVSLLRLLGMRQVDLVLFGWLRALSIVSASCLMAAAAWVAATLSGLSIVDRAGLLSMVPLLVVTLVGTPLVMAAPRRNVLVDLRDR
ncbi:hypothetical protein Q9R32_01280 [Actinotalea sp. AC32]|nr:hypothetical protein [Actinotalea sp. AC32]